MRKKLKIAILGATGVVGRNMLSELEKSGLDIAEIKLLASKRSVGRKMLFNGQEIEVEEATDSSFRGMDVVFEIY